LNQISQWQKMDLTHPVSVNISAHQLQQANFVGRLADHPDVSSCTIELEVLAIPRL